MFDKSAQIYDAIYLKQKDYALESAKIKQLIQQHKHSDGNRLLDIACGTGLHLQWLQDTFQVAGLDVQSEMLQIAQERLPHVPFYQADMSSFELEQFYDVILCLFSSIGYVKTYDKLVSSISCMYRHLVPGGLLLLEPWFTPQTWRPGTVHAVFIDEPGLKIARVNTSLQEGSLSVMDMHYLVGTPEKTVHLVEHHEMGLFEVEEIISAFTTAGLDVFYDPEGLTGRGIYIAKKSIERDNNG